MCGDKEGLASLIVVCGALGLRIDEALVTVCGAPWPTVGRGNNYWALPPLPPPKKRNEIEKWINELQKDREMKQQVESPFLPIIWSGIVVPIHKGRKETEREWKGKRERKWKWKGEKEMGTYFLSTSLFLPFPFSFPLPRPLLKIAPLRIYPI